MKKLNINLFFVLLLAATFHVRAQGSFWKSKNAYLGQTLPNDTPKIFAQGILCDTGSWAGDRVAFSADGKEFYYGHAKNWFTSDNETLYFKYTGNKWTGPLLVTKHYYAPTFSMDGQTLYLSQAKKVWQVNRTEDGWSQPMLYMDKKYGLYDLMPTLSGNIYVGSNGNQGNIKDWSTYNFCRITINNSDTVIKSLGIPINAPGFNGDFYVAPDESYMLISDKETKDFKAEIYISFHKSGDTWTNPKSLGPLINNGLADRWGEYVTPDKKYLFFTQGTDSKHCFLYWVRFDKMLKRLKRSNFEPYVKNPLQDQHTKTGQPFSFRIPDDVFIDDDGNNTLTFSLTMENGDELPAWVQFNPKTKTLTETATKGGTYKLQIRATDPAKATASCKFNLLVTD